MSNTETFITCRSGASDEGLIAGVEYKISLEGTYDIDSSIPRELLVDRVNRLKKVTYITTNEFDWIDEVILVSLGKKPIALTHFDTVEPGQWDDEAYAYAILHGVRSMPITEHPAYVTMSRNREWSQSLHIPVANLYKQGIPTPTFNSTLSLGSIIWFRDDTMLDALVLYEDSKPRVEGSISWRYPYNHIIQGILYGYTEQGIKDYVLMQNEDPRLVQKFNPDDLDCFMNESRDYIEAKKKEISTKLS